MTRPASVEEILASYNDKAQLSEASTIPAPWYVDPRIAELENFTVFTRSWQAIGRADQIEKPGQFVTATVAGEPIVAKLWLKLLDPRAPGGGRAGDSASQTEIRTTASNNGSGYGGGRGARQLSSPLSSFRGSRGEI